MSEAELKQVQRFADRYGIEVHIVGSRADGTAGENSDYDYIIGTMGGTSRLRQKARRELPRGSSGGEVHSTGRETGIDVFKEPLDGTRPFITVSPQSKEIKK